MAILKRVFKFLTGRSNKNNSKKSNIISFYSVNKVSTSDNTFEQLYVEYDKFNICQCDATYCIDIFFPKETKKDVKNEIFNFVKEGFDQNSNPLMIFLNTGMTFNVSVYHKCVKEEKKLKLYIGKTRL